MNIGIGGDHAGFEYKGEIIKFIESNGHKATDFGPGSAESVDYPDHVHPLAEAVKTGDCTFGILICGSANGVAMTANKHQEIRAGLAWNKEVAELIRQHNNANVLCIPARFTTLEQAIELVSTFLNTDFEGGRHKRRVDKISCN
ncbi:ribose 5-phosphate isomerase B [Reichenbachiella versicolor]|uniref:ribose 5-phosphate isomerase B n=1 Tax=Reichenbachiella versicolor TaxID=1821036 RepID=UPI000D6E356D|nr:ribose 5-phosphate isomerase B [Reichenbachiella versicolor]